MDVIVAGLGSMGKRRIRLLKQLYPSYQVVGVDTSEDRRLTCEAEFGIVCYESIRGAFAGEPYVPEAIRAGFVCNPPLAHADTIHALLEYGCHVFTEINLVSAGYERNIRLAAQKGLTLFLSSTLNYRRDIREIQAQLASLNIDTAYIYHVGQYLPDWHPWESYKDFFVAEKKTNGVRELMGIDLPWIYKAFGNISEIIVRGGNVSGLDLGYPDIFFVVLTHESGHKGMVCFDVAARTAVRRLEVMGENLHILWDGMRDASYSEAAYTEEIQYFFGAIAGGKDPLYTFEDDYKVVRWMDEIESKCVL